MAKLVYMAGWSNPPKPFRKRGDKAEIGKDIAIEDAQMLAKAWPGAFKIEGKIDARTTDVPANDRMRRGPERKRGKSHADD